MCQDSLYMRVLITSNNKWEWFQIYLILPTDFLIKEF